MNSSRICTILFGSMPFTAVWEVAIHAAADGSPPAELVAAGAGPQVIAVGLIVALAAAGPDADRQPRTDVPVQARRQVTNRVAQKELAR
ncbi:hypothetical protein [Micromonospora peucetia]|uniref:Uncharacterized protein n=1 Tax=Micromonospora peucetia TaxID=47871 RepID=A0ABZ1EK14_9ACTN|nr:hypothetical protein [Micromonospora peucetia]WSA34569.1 hypothetical protein OIE14_11245 [Micromonospora peucetia]